MANFAHLDKSLKFNHSQSGLIPGLPDDLALECLLRVSITSHPTLRFVSLAWRSAISDASFYTDRRRLGLAEHVICLVQPLFPPPPEQLGTTKDHQAPEAPVGGLPLYNLNIYNLTSREWRRLSFTVPTFAQCVAVPTAAKLVVLGGWDPQTLEPLTRVLVIDLVKGTWKEGSPMPTARSFFACTAVARNSTIAVVYVAGGHDGQKNALRSAEAYDVAADRWWSLPPMLEERDESQGLSFDGSKFWVVSGYGTESQGRFRSDAEIFDPEIGSWSKIEGVWPYPTTTPKCTVSAAVPGGRRRRWLFVGDGELREFEWEEERWKNWNMGRIPKRVSGSSSILLVDVGDGNNERIFVMGNGENWEGECEEECGGEGVFIWEREIQNLKDNDKENGGAATARWKHVHAPCRFLGLPFSASQLLI